MFECSFQRIVVSAVLAVGVFAVSSFALGAEIIVTESLDAIPAPEGSLRWALEKSESNGEADTILFAIDVDRIFLVAPLPTLTEGGTAIGRALDSDGAGVEGAPLTLDGDGKVEYAFEIVSAGNTIAELGFEGFTGGEIIRLLGEGAVDNRVVACVFLSWAGPGVDPRSALRLAEGGPGQPGVPSRTKIQRNSFYGFDRAIDFEAPVVSIPPIAHSAQIISNRFGSETPEDPSRGNSYDIYSNGTGGGLVIRKNVFNGPGVTAIRLADGAETNTIHHNRIGYRGVDGTPCQGYSAPGIELSRMPRTSMESNRFVCVEVGISALESRDLFINQNHFDATLIPAGAARVAIDINDCTGTIRRNTIVAYAEGIRAALMEGNGDLVYSCNQMSGDELIEPIVETTFLAEPPVLDFSNLLDVRGTVLDGSHGWVEIFGSDDGIAISAFQGAGDAGGIDPGFRHRLPVLNLRMEEGAAPGAVRLFFDATDPAQHRGSRTRLDMRDSSSLSPGFVAEPTPIVYDLVRGDASELVETGDGNVSLGAVDCIARGLIAADLPVVDEALPSPGTAFFYVVRKRLDVEAGTYDAAICGTELDQALGERLPREGDCPPAG